MPSVDCQLHLKRAKRWVGILTLGCWSLSALPAQAEDLLGAYKRALENDRQWTAAKARVASDQQYSEMAKSLYLPKVQASSITGYSTYKSDATQLRVDPDLQGQTFFGEIFNCLGSINNPEIDCNPEQAFGVTLEDNVKEDYILTEFKLSLLQPVYSGTRKHDSNKAKAMSNKAAAELRVANQDLIMRLSKAYFDVARRLDDLRLADGEVAESEKGLKLAIRRYEQGVDNETEIYDAQAQYDLVVSKQALARSILEGTRRTLTQNTNYYDPDVYLLKQDLPVVPPSPENPDAWVKEALAHNAGIESLQWGVEVLKSDYYKQRAGYLPSVNFGVQYTNTETSGGQGFTPGGENAQIGFEISMPLYQGGLVSASSKQALYKYQEGKETLLGKQLELEIAVRNLHTAVTTHAERITLGGRSVRSLNVATRAVERAYSGGTKGVHDVVDKRIKALSAQREVAQARYDYVYDSLRLKFAAGFLSENDLLSLNGWLVPLASSSSSTEYQ